MSLKISKTNTPAYDYLSEGTGSNPAVRTVTIDKTGGTKTSSALQLYLIATQAGNPNIGSYTGIEITPSTLTTGITWEVSLNGTTFTSSINPSDMDCESADVITPIWVRVVVDNTEASPISTGNYEGEFLTTAVENPPA